MARYGRQTWWAFGVITLGAILTACDGQNDRDSENDVRLRPDDPAVIAEGRGIYENHCASCHGKNLEGQPDWRKPLPTGRMPAPPHDGTGHTWHHPTQVLFQITKHGPQSVAGPDYKSDMPAYKDVLTDRQIIAVLSFIKSEWPRNIQRRHDDLDRRARAERR